MSEFRFPLISHDPTTARNNRALMDWLRANFSEDHGGTDPTLPPDEPIMDLNDLQDVNAGDPLDEETLSWDTGSQRWIPSLGIPGTTLHSALTDIHTDQHHSRYTDEEARIAVLPRMRWQNTWVDLTQYEIQDVVRDGRWTMVANKQTTLRPAPQPLGSPTYAYGGVGTTTPVTTTSVIFGNRYTIGKFGTITGYRIYTVTGNEYEVYTVLDPLGDEIVSLVSTFTATNTGWFEITTSPAFIGPGQVFDVLALVREPDPTPTVFTGNWDYDTPQNSGVPGAGEIIQANSSTSLMQISKTDDDSGDRSTELEGLLVGDVIQYGTGTRYSIESTSDDGTYMTFGVAPASQSTPDGVELFTFETVTATPITYFLDTDYWLTSGLTVQGRLKVGAAAAVLDDTAYGTDLLLQEYEASPDWDLLTVMA